jgi:hypothetical protein
MFPDSSTQTSIVHKALQLFECCPSESARENTLVQSHLIQPVIELSFSCSGSNTDILICCALLCSCALCPALAEVQKSVLKQASVQHLYGRLAGVLRRGVGDAAVLEALHPTPAVCGRPREAAMRWVVVLWLREGHRAGG